MPNLNDQQFPDNILEELRNLKARIESLEQRDVNAVTVDQLAAALGDFTEGAFWSGTGDPNTPDAETTGGGLMMPGFEWNGQRYILFTLNGGQFSFGISPTTGEAIFLNGNAIIGRSGIQVNGLNVPYTHTAGTGSNARTGILSMMGEGVPAWNFAYKRPVAAVSQVESSTTWTTEGSYISASGRAATIITNQVSGGDVSATATSERMKTYPGAEHTFRVTIQRGLTQYAPDCSVRAWVYWYEKGGTAFKISPIVHLYNGDIPSTPTTFTLTEVADDRVDRFAIEVSGTRDYSGFNQSILITDITADRAACEEIMALRFSSRGASFENTPIFMEKLVEDEVPIPPTPYHGSIYMLMNGELYTNNGYGKHQVGETVARSLLFLKGI